MVTVGRTGPIRVRVPERADTFFYCFLQMAVPVVHRLVRLEPWVRLSGAWSSCLTSIFRLRLILTIPSHLPCTSVHGVVCNKNSDTLTFTPCFSYGLFNDAVGSWCYMAWSERVIGNVLEGMWMEVIVAELEMSASVCVAVRKTTMKGPLFGSRIECDNCGIRIC